ncbi:MAG: hypothetical protein U0836_20590 [Pirellulales bacterium]
MHTTKRDFYDRLAEHGREDIQASLTQYRALVEELSRDATYEFDVEDTQAILNTLHITVDDMRRDAETLAAMRDDESRVLTEAQRQASMARQKAASERVVALQAEIPTLRAQIRLEESTRHADMHLRGELGRRKQANPRLYGDAAEVERRLAAGLPTGPRAGSGGPSLSYQPQVTFSGARQ